MGAEETDCRWLFLGYESFQEGRPVQAWFDGLPDDHRDAVKDQLQWLQITPRSEWVEPFFDPLVGEGGISEIRFDPIKCEKGKFYYRIYGFFAEEDEAYVFLHATNKTERNDKRGKGTAKRRLRQLTTDNRTKTRELNLDEKFPSEETEEGP